MCHFDTIVIFHGCDMVLILTMYHNNYLQHWIIFSFPCIIDDMYISQMHILKKSKYTETHCFVLQGFSVSFTNIFYFHLNTSAWFWNVVVRNEIQSIQWHNEKYYKGLCNRWNWESNYCRLEAPGLKDWAAGNTAFSAFRTVNCCRALRISNVQSGYPVALWRAEPSVEISWFYSSEDNKI